MLAELDHQSWVSGAELGDRLRISRAAIWKHIAALRNTDIAIAAERGRGYRLEQPIDLIDPSAIQKGLPNGVQLDFQTIVDSTNAVAWRHPPSEHALVALCEAQTAGRGRRGRSWQSPPASGICLSFRRRFERPLAAMSSLALVAGCLARQSLPPASQENVGIKWPNDLVANGRKLGGILIELRGELDGPCDAVIGIGINVRLAPATKSGIEQPTTDLTDLGDPRTRSEIAADLISALDAGLRHFDESGFAAFQEAWVEADIVRGQDIVVRRDHQEDIEGVAEGVSADGRLQVATSSGTLLLNEGEVSIRVR